jgi:hypothetical protein
MMHPLLRNTFEVERMAFCLPISTPLSPPIYTFPPPTSPTIQVIRTPLEIHIQGVNTEGSYPLPRDGQTILVFSNSGNSANAVASEITF